MTMEGDGSQFKIIFQCFNGFLTCSSISGELLYITILDSRIPTLRIYPEDIVS